MHVLVPCVMALVTINDNHPHSETIHHLQPVPCAWFPSPRSALLWYRARNALWLQGSGMLSILITSILFFFWSQILIISFPGSWRPFGAERRVGLCRSKQSNSGRVLSYYHLLYIDIIIYHADIYVASAPTLNVSCFCNPSGGSGRMPQKPGSMGSYRKLMQDHLLWQVFDASQDHYKWEMPKPMKILCFFSRTSLWGAVIVVLEKCHLRLCHFKCKHVIKPVYISLSPFYQCIWYPNLAIFT